MAAREDGPNARRSSAKGDAALTDAAAVWLPLDALTPHPKNPRAHGPEVTRLARTILRTAWGAPIVAQWRASGRHRVIAGHGRLLAAREILAGVEVDGELRGGAEHRFDTSAPAPGLLPVRACVCTSSSPHSTSKAVGYSLRRVRATGCKLPASKAQAVRNSCCVKPAAPICPICNRA